MERSEPAATRMHLWLERTAFYKVPKSHQDEVAEECHKPFEQVRHPSVHSILETVMMIMGNLQRTAVSNGAGSAISSEKLGKTPSA